MDKSSTKLLIFPVSAFSFRSVSLNIGYKHTHLSTGSFILCLDILPYVIYFY